VIIVTVTLNHGGKQHADNGATAEHNTRSHSKRSTAQDSQHEGALKYWLNPPIAEATVIKEPYKAGTTTTCFAAATITGANQHKHDNEQQQRKHHQYSQQSTSNSSSLTAQTVPAQTAQTATTPPNYEWVISTRIGSGLPGLSSC
jgi:hypothetical protein